MVEFTSPEAECKFIGGRYDPKKNTCTIEKYYDLAEEVASCIIDYREKVPVEEEFNGYNVLDECIVKTTTNRPFTVVYDEKKLRDEMERMFSEDEPRANLVIIGKVPDWAEYWGYGDEQISVPISDFYKPPHFDAKWHSTDPWRGYYDTISDDEYVKIGEFTILHWHPTEPKYKEAYEALENFIKSLGGTLVASFERTSNLFASGATLFVDKETWEKYGEEVEKYLEKLEETYGVEF